MRKILFLLFLVFVLSGCVTYKFQKSTASNAQGFLAYYDNKPILEYTVGKEKSLPDLTLAKERFKHRRPTVERYYKQMGQMESRLRETFWDPPVMILDFFWGVLRWPFIAVADYRYNHNSKYKARVDRLDEEKEALQTARIDSLRKKLDAYIAEDLFKESFPQGVVTAPALPVIQEVMPAKAEISPVNPEAAPEPLIPSAAPAAAVVQPPIETKPVVVEEALATKAVLEPPVTVIVAQPVKGYSPLRVNFSSQKSHSRSGKIVSYLWDFGDGETSTQKNPENTYWSTTFGSRSFTATLTVRDQAGSVSSATSIIEVITR